MSNLTIKDVKEFQGLTTKDRNELATKIGATFSEGTAMGKIAMMALAAGIDAKANGDKTFKFDATFNAFAATYYDNAKDSTVNAYRSAFGNWTKAGMHAAWDARETALRVWNERQYPLTARSGMLSKLLKLDHVPTATDYKKAKPKKRNNNADQTYAEAVASLDRKVAQFLVDWEGDMSKAHVAAFATVVAAMDAFVKAVPKDAETKKGNAKKSAEKKPTPAQLRDAARAKLLEMASAGVKTLQ